MSELRTRLLPLYGPAALDAAVAAERERCASICDALARVGDSRDAAACAAAIRGHAVEA